MRDYHGKNMNEINRNFVWCSEYSDQSFVGRLHEEAIWDDEQYFRLENYLYEECEKYSNQAELPRNIFWPAMQIYSYLSFSISCHFDPNDGFVLKELNTEQICNRRERLQGVFEGFFKGEMPDKRLLGY